MYYVNLFLKRVFDIISSAIGIALLLPVWIIIPILIKIDSKGPVIFKQSRRTINGKIFNIYKFRTMKVHSENQGPGLFNYEDDPRVTKIGKFLRKSSIDELPQLFNIFLGSMSVVGPRPCVSYELGDFDTLNKKYKKRFRMKAGLTGYAQVMGRNDITWDEKVKFDNIYIDKFKKYGVIFDVKILFHSVIKVFKKENIYEIKEENVDSITASQLAEAEVIRLAHIPDLEEDYEN